MAGKKKPTRKTAASKEDAQDIEAAPDNAVEQAVETHDVERAEAADDAPLDAREVIEGTAQEVSTDPADAPDVPSDGSAPDDVDNTANVTDSTDGTGDTTADETAATDTEKPEEPAPWAADDSAIDSDQVTEDSAPVPAPPATVPPVQVEKVGFWPVVLGGIAAAFIGVALAYIIFPEMGVLNKPDGAFRDEVARTQSAQSEQLAAQEAQLAALSDRIDAAGQGGPAPDLSGIEAAQDDMQTQLSALAEQVSALSTQVAALEARPVSDGTGVSQGEISALQEALAGQQAEIAALNADAAAQEEAARASATATLRRAALTRIRTALDTGMAFGPALADLEASGVDIPDALRAASADGVPAMAALQDSFPPSARAALAASRDELEAAGAGDTGVWAFFSDQLGARSLEPREGDDPDAVLSRVEFALREARLNDALAEIETLPATGRDALADWADTARTRMNAVDAADALGAELN